MAKILIVEDDQFLRDLYHDLLQQEGYEVSLAEDGEQAVQQIQAGPHDLVLLDVMMPKKDGFTLGKEIR